MQGLRTDSVFRGLAWAALVGLAVWSPLWAQAGSETTKWVIDPDASLVAVVTNKEGLASGLAHQHLIAAPVDQIELSLDPADPGAARVFVEFDAVALQADDPELQAAWQQDLLDLGALSAPFADLSPKDRRKIRQSMLGPKQLDAKRHPQIRASVTDVRIEGDAALARLAFEVRGRTVERQVEVPWPALEDGKLRVAFSEEFRFTEFGIKPYSALLGAIRVADEFALVVRLVAAPVE